MTTTVNLNKRDRETIRSAVEMMAEQASCGGGFNRADWDDVKRVLQIVKEPKE